MKVVYEDREKEILKEIYDQYPNSHMFDLDPDKVYSVNFKITNPSVAEYVLRGLLFDRLEDFDLGIQVTSINLIPHIDRNELRQKLYDAIDEIIQ